MTGKLVYLPQERWREVYFALQDSAATETLDAFRDAWDAARDPADAIGEAIARRLYQDHASLMEYDPPVVWDDESEGHRGYWRQLARPFGDAVLQVLGIPEVSA